MAKKTKNNNVNFYYMKQEEQKETIEDSSIQRKKAKEREKRIRQARQTNPEDTFDLETEMVIGMTNQNKIKKEIAKKRELSKKEKQKAKRIKRIKKILKWTTIFFLISGAIIFALTSPIFKIKEIEVVNNTHVSKDTIISLSGINSEMNIFKFISYSIEEKIKENAYIESAEINRILPNKIQIKVEERIPKFSIQVLSSYVYINNQGYLLEINQNELGLPIITGIQTAEEERIQGNRLIEEDLLKLEEILKIMSAAKENNLDTKVTSIDISEKNEYSIIMQEEEKTIYLGDVSNLSTKMIYLQGILEQTKGKSGKIYINGDLNKKFRPYFKEEIPT